MNLIMLYACARYGYRGCLQALIDIWRGSLDAEVRETNGLTALHVAAHYGDTEIVKLLLQSGARPQAWDYVQRLPLHLACSQMEASCVESLLTAAPETVHLRFAENSVAALDHFVLSNVIECTLGGAKCQRCKIGDDGSHSPDVSAAKTLQLLLENGADTAGLKTGKPLALELLRSPSTQYLFLEAVKHPAVLPDAPSALGLTPLLQIARHFGRKLKYPNIMKCLKALLAHRGHEIDFDRKFREKSATKILQSHKATKALSVISDFQKGQPVVPEADPTLPEAEEDTRSFSFLHKKAVRAH
jgi:hypothetical protein